jgi:hypothetical protein
MDQDRYYRPSGAVPFVGTLLMLLCGGAAAAVLSFVYGLLTAYNPYVYVTFLATVLFGLGMGAAVVAGAVVGNVRNRAFVAVVAACVGLAGLYLSWAVYIPYVLRQMGWKGAPFIFEPEYLFTIIQAFGETGVRKIHNWVPKGWILYSLWLTESALVLGASLTLALAPRKPFCEFCRRWTSEDKPDRPLALADPDRLRIALENERYEVLDELREGESALENCLRVTLHTCPRCAESNYLTVSHVQLTTDRQGNVQTKSTDLVQRLRIPESLVEHLRRTLNEHGELDAPMPDAAPGAAAADDDGEPQADGAAATETAR